MIANPRRSALRGLPLFVLWLFAAHPHSSAAGASSLQEDDDVTTPEEAAAPSEDFVVFDDIVVTARLVEEDISDVPFTVNVVDAEEIRLSRVL